MSGIGFDLTRLAISDSSFPSMGILQDSNSTNDVFFRTIARGSDWQVLARDIIIHASPSEVGYILLKICETRNLPLLEKVLVWGIDCNTPIDSACNTMLHYFCRHGLIDHVRVLLAHDITVGPVNSDLRNAIQEAVFFGQQEVVQEFLSKNHLLIHVRTGSGLPLLHIAALARQLSMMQFLLDKTHDPGAIDSETATALHRCAKIGFLEGVSLLCNRVKGLTKDRFGNTALHYAAKNGSSDVVGMLCEHFPRAIDEVNDQNNQTALHMAICADREEAFRLLLSSGANCKLLYEKKTPIIELLYTYQQRAIDAHRKIVAEFAELDLAMPAPKATLDVYGCIELCLGKGGRIDSANSDGETLLYIACSRGDTRMVRFCLDKHALTNLASSTGWTPLHVAAKSGFVDIAELLLRYGADVDAKNRDGRTPLHIAVEYQREQMVRFLLQNRANITSQDIHGKTVLHILCQDGRQNTHQNTSQNEALLQLLVQAGAGIGVMDQTGKTPLDGISSELQEQVLRRLDVSEANRGSLLAVACRIGCTSFIRDCFARGMDPEQKNDLGLQPLETVPMSQSSSLIELFSDFAYLKDQFSLKKQDSMQKRYLYYAGMHVGSFLVSLGITSLFGMPLLAAPIQACLPSVASIAADVYNDYNKVQGNLRAQEGGSLGQALPQLVDTVYERQDQLQGLLQELRENPDLILMDSRNARAANPLEVAFLLGDFALMQKLKERMGGQFDTFYSLFLQKYPHACQHLFAECRLYPNLALQGTFPLQGEVYGALEQLKHKVIEEIATSLLRPLSMHRVVKKTILDQLQERFAFRLKNLLATKVGIQSVECRDESKLDTLLDCFIPVDDPKKHEGDFLGRFWASYNAHAIITFIEDAFKSSDLPCKTLGVSLVDRSVVRRFLEENAVLITR